MAVTLNASTTTGLVQSADTSGEINLQSNGTTKLSVLSTGVSGVITQGTVATSTSGTSIDFLTIPSWVKRITVMFNGVSTNGTSSFLIQIGAGSVTTSGYVGNASSYANTIATSTAGFVLTQANVASVAYSGHIVITNLTSNTWVESSVLIPTNSQTGQGSGGNIALGGTLDRVRITTVNGTDTFDAGTINILYEG
jgi:hypothetical protein